MSDETEMARNHLIMLMPIEYKNYIKTALAGDFACAVRNRLDDQQATIDKLVEALKEVMQVAEETKQTQGYKDLINSVTEGK